MAANIFAQGMAAYDDGWNRQQTATDQAARVRAGRRLAAGDRSGAAGAFAESGMIPEARQMQGDQAAIDNQAYERGRQKKTDDLAESERKVQTLSKLAKGLQGVPAGQRVGALQRALPIFEQLGMDPAQFATLTEDQLTDEQLQVFAGELEKQWQVLNLGNGGAAKYNNRTGDFETLREPDKPTILRQGDTLLGEDNRPVYTAPKTFAPPRPRGSGGSTSLPPGY